MMVLPPDIFREVMGDALRQATVPLQSEPWETISEDGREVWRKRADVLGSAMKRCGLAAVAVEPAP